MRKSLLFAALSAVLPLYMSDVQASAEPAAPNDAGGVSDAPTTVVISAADASGSSGSSGAGEAGNDVSGADTEAAASDTAADGGTNTGTPADSADDSGIASGEPSRESLIAHMHALFDALETKLATGVHVFAHEVAAIRDQVTKVL